jgi:hypothetical protein
MSETSEVNQGGNVIGVSPREAEIAACRGRAVVLVMRSDEVNQFWTLGYGCRPKPTQSCPTQALSDQLRRTVRVALDRRARPALGPTSVAANGVPATIHLVPHHEASRHRSVLPAKPPAVMPWAGAWLALGYAVPPLRSSPRTKGSETARCLSPVSGPYSEEPLITHWRRRQLRRGLPP